MENGAGQDHRPLACSGKAPWYEVNYGDLTVGAPPKNGKRF